jgi:hypothetical protein
MGSEVSVGKFRGFKEAFPKKNRPAFVLPWCPTTIKFCCAFLAAAGRPVRLIGNQRGYRPLDVAGGQVIAHLVIDEQKSSVNS